MQFDPFLFDGSGRNVSCARCGVQERTVGGRPPPEIAPFVHGNYVEIRTMGVCHNCYTTLCGQCAPGGRCPDCRGM